MSTQSFIFFFSRGDNVVTLEPWLRWLSFNVGESRPWISKFFFIFEANSKMNHLSQTKTSSGSYTTRQKWQKQILETKGSILSRDSWINIRYNITTAFFAMAFPMPNACFICYENNHYWQKNHRWRLLKAPATYFYLVPRLAILFVVKKFSYLSIWIDSKLFYMDSS